MEFERDIEEGEEEGVALPLLLMVLLLASPPRAPSSPPGPTKAF